MPMKTAATSADIERQKWLDRVENGLRSAPAEIVRLRFHLTRGELRDLFPDYFDDEPEPERTSISGY